MYFSLYVLNFAFQIKWSNIEILVQIHYINCRTIPSNFRSPKQGLFCGYFLSRLLCWGRQSCINWEISVVSVILEGDGETERRSEMERGWGSLGEGEGDEETDDLGLFCGYLLSRLLWWGRQPCINWEISSASVILD